MATRVEVYSVGSEQETRAFAGFGSLAAPAIVFLHPGTGTGLQPGDRARCRIVSTHSRLTIDGQVLDAPRSVTGQPPVAVQLAVGFAGPFDGINDVPQGPGHPTPDEAAQAVRAFVAEAGRHDPAKPSSPPPAGPDVYGQLPHPGARPWYCVICPGAFGC